MLTPVQAFIKNKVLEKITSTLILLPYYFCKNISFVIMIGTYTRNYTLFKNIFKNIAALLVIYE